MKKKYINPLLQVGSGYNEKSNGSGSGGPKINGSDRIRILIPGTTHKNYGNETKKLTGNKNDRQKNRKIV